SPLALRQPGPSAIVHDRAAPSGCPDRDVQRRRSHQPGDAARTRHSGCLRPRRCARRSVREALSAAGGPLDHANLRRRDQAPRAVPAMAAITAVLGPDELDGHQGAPGGIGRCHPSSGARAVEAAARLTDIGKGMARMTPITHTGAGTPSYVLVTAARNEAEFIEL